MFVDEGGGLGLALLAPPGNALDAYSYFKIKLIEYEI